ncbi:hypothetical protein UFOVP1247_312 [uncultured Caudovirales phage]|uniref:Baseplate wedge subunit n=1 Tax=uncultured Caudovirales phage TaxID=2100421 RepID=A0A6J5RJZ8_9CAUD|nr:hypothetical protein UFOVP970_352 [uncultured Caudovirales phage]CAB4193941.1 hypothetical protein UFOVP1247_312 [uncultured Caudovirales phage]
MANVVDNFKVFKRLSIYVEDILSQTINYLTVKFSQSKAVFTSASPFGQLLLVVENLTQLVFFYIEDSITELNINEATRLTSIYSLATLAGHNPSRAVSAVGEISLSTKAGAGEPPTDFVIIPNLTRIRCANNGLVYVLDLPQDEIKFSFNGTNNGLKIGIRQGVIESQTVVSKGEPIESFSIGSPQNYYIDNFMVNVHVNGEKWTKYDSIIDMPRGEKAYLIKTGITSGVDLFFGNGNYGKVPARGSEILVEYLITEGSNGNIRTDDLASIKFDFIDTGFSLLGDEINLNDYVEVTSSNAPFFGTNSEDSKLTRLLAPRQSKSFALVNIDHYESVLKKLKLFSIINVALDETDSRMLNLFLIPDIRKTFSTAQDYFSADLNRFMLDNYQKNQLLQYIEKSGSKMISTEIQIIDPIASEYVINTSIIAFDDVSTDIIKRDILNNLGEYFIQNTRLTRIPKSDLIKIVEEVNGVDSVSINIISKNNEISKIQNPSAMDIGLDEFNDIIIAYHELPLIRGGFTDRSGNVYSTGITDESLGPVNIQIKSIVPRPKKVN